MELYLNFMGYVFIGVFAGLAICFIDWNTGEDITVRYAWVVVSALIAWPLLLFIIILNWLGEYKESKNIKKLSDIVLIKGRTQDTNNKEM